MSKKVVDAFQPKITRNDRFAQMSHQEKVIEQKKKEIQLKLEAKQKANAEGKTNSGSSSGSGTSSSNSNNNTSKPTKSSPKIQDVKKSSGFNIFSNDGSFLDQFKQLKDKKSESKLKSFKSNDKDERGNKSSRWITKRRSSSPKERTQKLARVSRFSDKSPTFEPKITINTSFNTAILSTAQQNFESQSLMTHNVTGQPLMKNLISPPSLVVFPTVNQSNNSDPVITAPPVLLNVPPPQIVANTLVLPAPNAQNVNIIQSQAVLSAVTIPPPAIIPQAVQTVELSAIPPPNPIQVQNIPQPEPINALNIPPPAPIQVQNIPTPSSIQLNEIPNPQPLDLLAIPTPQDDKNGGTITGSDFIKNVPPPNKSVPPPNLTDSSGGSTVIQLSTNLGGTLVHNLPPPPPQTQINLTNQGSFAAVTVVANPIPSLMAQPILPPPGMGMTNVNVNCPPPLLSLNSGASSGLQPPPPPFVRQLPPINTNQMPSMSVPPPTGLNILVSGGTFKDLNSVFPPGTPDYEAMASLARMVAQCGSSFEEVVRQRKNQDPSHWFLFHKESSAYQQYLQLVDQFKLELEQDEMKIENKYKPEEIYEPETVTDDFDLNSRSLDINQETNELPDIMNNKQRKRRSRWGDKDPNIPPPTAVVMYNNSQNDVTIPVVNHSTPIQGGPVMLSRVSRTDPALIQYALNTFGSTNLTEDEWKKAEDHYKINLLYQDMVRKREEVERLKLAGKNKYDYDSDEETDGGTWEHRLREKEMMATQLWAQELTRQAEGKHHIGDFLPPEEMKRFMEKSSAAKEGRQPNFSDYKEFKIKEDNIGFKMLQKLGWSEGEGLGTSGGGIIEPVNKAANRDHNQGLGLNETEESEDEYESYRKRMMLAYRFRPNPLNNPRRPYY